MIEQSHLPFIIPGRYIISRLQVTYYVSFVLNQPEFGEIIKQKQAPAR